MNDKIAELDALLAHTHEAASIWHEAWRTWLREAAINGARYEWLRQIDRCIEWENLLRCKFGTITGGEQIDSYIDAAMIPKGTAAARSTSDSAQEPDAPGAPASPAGADLISRHHREADR